MSNRPGIALSLPGSLLIHFCLLIGQISLMSSCTSCNEGSAPQFQEEPPPFALLYLDASEANNRRVLQQWAQKQIDTWAEDSLPFMAFFSNYDEPIVATDLQSFAQFRRALSQHFPPIPKPREEADRIHHHLRDHLASVKENSLLLHIFLSGSFHDISKNPFFEQLFQSLGSNMNHVELFIYTEAAVSEEKQYRHAALRSVTYIPLTNDHPL